jgi:hypothetical protein
LRPFFCLYEYLYRKTLMTEIIITERQLDIIKGKVISEDLINEAWYNTVMDILGIIDPTPVVDIINATSYFIQGDTLFGILTIVGAIPYAGDIVAKPVLGALKVGGPSVKALESAIKLAKNAPVGSAEYKAAQEILEKLTKEPGVIGTFLQKMGGSLGDKIIKTIDEIPMGPFKGMKNTIKTYFELLRGAGKKSVMFQKRAGVLKNRFKNNAGSVKDVELLKKYLVDRKIVNSANLSKPGFFTNVFFGGIPRLFRDPSQRRIRILMQSSKWWLGFLDYIGLGNWVGAEELVKQMGEENFAKKVEEYNQTPEAKENFDDQFSDSSQGQSQQQSSQTSQTGSPRNDVNLDPLAKFLKNMLLGQINPIPGI